MTFFDVIISLLVGILGTGGVCLFIWLIWRGVKAARLKPEDPEFRKLVSEMRPGESAMSQETRDTVALASMAVVCFGMLFLGIATGVFVASILGVWDKFNGAFDKPLASLTLNDLLAILGGGSIVFLGGWVGKVVGIDMMHDVEQWFIAREGGGRDSPPQKNNTDDNF